MRRKYGKRNPLTSTEDLFLAAAGAVVLGLVGYAIYSKNQQASSGVMASNTLINPPQSASTQSTYNAYAAGTAYGQGQTSYGNTGAN